MKNRAGMTLIEIIMAMVIIGLAFYSLIAVFITLAPRGTRVENLNKKLYLAQEKIEETLTRSFSQVQSVNPTAFTGAGFISYNYQILVTYVATSDVNTPVGGPTPFKNVKVRVWGGPVDLSSTVEITSLAVNP